MNKFRFLLLISILSVGTVAFAQIPDKESCTSIMVGKNASVDGSVITSHTCDSYYRTWVTWEPAATNKLGTMETIYKGRLNKSEDPYDMRNVESVGKIPAAESTFRYLNTAYPCLNEKQLAIGETTTSGRRELVNKDGMFDIEELERLALQRCDNAKDAIKLMGSMAEKYGYGDWGECLTVADKNEVWHFEIYGSGPGKPSALWVAQRIPDDHVGVSANIPRIGEVKFNDNNFMYSTDLKKKAKELGFWDGKSPFVFHKVVNGRKPFSIREYYILSTLAPSLNLKLDAEELPFSVKPESKVSLEKVFELFRTTYEGTEHDQTKNLWAEVKRSQKLPDGTIKEWADTVRPFSPFMNRDTRNVINKLNPETIKSTRTVAVIQCAYSHVIQLRNWLPDEIGGVAYLAFDNPAQSPRIPIYTGSTTLPASFAICGQDRYREDAAIWAFRETNRLATAYWDKTRKILEPELLHIQDIVLKSGPVVEKEALELINEGKKGEVAELLNRHTADITSLSTQRWKEIKSKILMIFVRSM